MKWLFVVSTVLSISIVTGTAYAHPIKGSVGDQGSAPAPSPVTSSAQNCVQADKLPPAYQRFFVTMVSAPFQLHGTPCSPNEPRVIVRAYTQNPTGGVSLDFTFDGTPKKVSGVDIYEVIAYVLKYVNNLTRRTAEAPMPKEDVVSCREAERFNWGMPDVELTSLFLFCSKAEVDAFVEKNWYKFDDAGRPDIAAMLAGRIGLTEEARRIRDAMQHIGFLDVNTPAAGIPSQMVQALVIFQDNLADF